MAKSVIPDSVDRTQLPLVELSLEQLNHEKALLKLRIREKGSQAQTLRKELGELNDAYEKIDLEMLSRDPRYKQEQLRLEAESEDD